MAGQSSGGGAPAPPAMSQLPPLAMCRSAPPAAPRPQPPPQSRPKPLAPPASRRPRSRPATRKTAGLALYSGGGGCTVARVCHAGRRGVQSDAAEEVCRGRDGEGRRRWWSLPARSVAAATLGREKDC
ncbi:hypothetical protein ACP70R_036654 [Stipagrostis hirtigluma subsp. patula]